MLARGSDIGISCSVTSDGSNNGAPLHLSIFEICKHALSCIAEMENNDVSIPAHPETKAAHSEDGLPPQRRTLFHLAVVAALAIPIGLVPCLVARRTTNTLSRRINESFTMIDKLQREVNI